ncbi:MAG: hydrogenase expression/formation protein HypE, partial [Gammaproteobacteria bacterium]|nr:hydrogenase expression/formation protein HypE [Gammaproteobacteria bacterium]
MKTTDLITLAHGNGGRHMRELVETLFAKKLSNPLLDTSVDACHLQLESPNICFTTDGFTVKPLEFPGGSIGSLAIHGTVNDLAVAGASPRYLSLNAFIEEGMSFEQLERIVDDMAQAAQNCNIQIVTGDTKVLPLHEASGVYFATTGIGIYNPGFNLGMDKIRPGDKILVNGSIGDHGTAVMLAREQYGLSGQLNSDSASVYPFTQALAPLQGVRFMRDPTRGGLATICVEITRQTKLGCYLHSTQIPIKPQVESVCEILGYDPFYLACEGRVVPVAPVAHQQWPLPGLHRPDKKG